MSGGAPVLLGAVGVVLGGGDEKGSSWRACTCCPALKMAMTPSLSMKTKMVALVTTLTG